MPGKVIVITGANGGLGRAISQRFAADGDTVIMLGRTLSKVQAVADEIGENAVAIECEVSSPDSVRAAFAQIAERYPRIDALINNAAVFQMLVLEEASDKQIIDAVMANLAGPMLCARSAIPLLGAGGHIINVSSESVEVTLPHLIPYQATKAGLEQFSRDLNLELMGKGIRVTTVRAGQMTGPGSSAEHDAVAAGRFFEAATKRGHHVMERGISQYASTVHIFRTVIDAPADVHIGVVSFQSRPAG
ncbi:SDR family oxidoreductase [Sphingomonas sp. BIUV-7]|uniref:SDR family oxidoreductase n=1 Tax=Sphingomonas natans TaxID=3063330 RepID=A0ABT8YA86_9SPHN|nr:SDR family oxidoreductase [Sphingomonas sp. BIUV-7]MDO6414570.1 SDR family oxidoreductase [Sphingomonas sp. BIUV-7]